MKGPGKEATCVINSHTLYFFRLLCFIKILNSKLKLILNNYWSKIFLEKLLAEVFLYNIKEFLWQFYYNNFITVSSVTSVKIMACPVSCENFLKFKLHPNYFHFNTLPSLFPTFPGCSWFSCWSHGLSRNHIIPWSSCFF